MDIATDEYISTEEYSESPLDDNIAEIAKTNIRNELGQLTMDNLLYDFDYMMYLIENAFPYIEMLKRKFDIDVMELAQDVRLMIENYPYSFHDRADRLGIAHDDIPSLDEQVFWAILATEFFGYMPPGLTHFRILSFDTFQWLMYPPAGAFSPFQPILRRNADAFNKETAMQFYLNQFEFSIYLAENDPNTIRLLFNYEEILLEPVVRTPPPLIATDIIEEGRVAYINFSTFMAFDLMPISLYLTPFYRSIQECEHLIIDIRNNSGGNPDFYRMLIMDSLWSDRDHMPNLPLYAFFLDTELGRVLGKEARETGTQQSIAVPETDRLLSVEELLAESELPNLNTNDLQNFAYGYRANTSLENITNRRFPQLAMEIPRVPFEGQIWLLTSYRNTSSAALFPRKAKYMGFATLVGEQVAGAYTIAFPVYFSLPNTGIILELDVDYVVDETGRALQEFPTKPHYFNREGLDALETVLQMIDEGR